MLATIFDAGISILIAGSFAPIIYYGFLCEPALRWTYLVAVGALSAVSFSVGMYSGLWPSPFWRLARVTAFTATGGFGVVSRTSSMFAQSHSSCLCFLDSSRAFSRLWAAKWLLSAVTHQYDATSIPQVPLGHLLARQQAGHPAWGSLFAYLSAMLGLYGLGVVLYTSRFPERFYPGRFDLWFSSHQVPQSKGFCVCRSRWIS
mmetsp:Transcript_2156/g.5642  ORF Transcript_2156/g.5642 Transcript_2156/m.5642 type:complete len:203 (+) Transcript_2156:415-1023(+)